MDGKELAASERFACGERDRALFEAGIKMGTLYHQFVGTPVSAETVDQLERSMAMAIQTQPFTVSAKVMIDRSSIPCGTGMFDYTSLTGEMIDAVIEVRVGETNVKAEMRYDRELDYPLMFISDVKRCDPRFLAENRQRVYSSIQRILPMS